MWRLHHVQAHRSKPGRSLSAGTGAGAHLGRRELPLPGGPLEARHRVARGLRLLLGRVHHKRAVLDLRHPEPRDLTCAPQSQMRSAAPPAQPTCAQLGAAPAAEQHIRWLHGSSLCAPPGSEQAALALQCCQATATPGTPWSRRCPGRADNNHPCDLESTCLGQLLAGLALGEGADEAGDQQRARRRVPRRRRAPGAPPPPPPRPPLPQLHPAHARMHMSCASSPHFDLMTHRQLDAQDSKPQLFNRDGQGKVGKSYRATADGEAAASAGGRACGPHLG